ncbi:hypothetical protein H2O64_12785 [Kordia sp. YSTF-M3]|uniref:PepSY domain-containing protein n=1 Tax=Kordia aestuariivivens TaxID=2759037 RepID=A0ABR7QAF4_9FLAO|nr:hypothetical protein [Kordia aestuariivivens]MBC8755545.1 hypothetical protein [Kordia aestuariivivens]
MKHVCLILFLCGSLVCTAQNSHAYKKEERIEKKAFPKNALDLLDKTLPKKIKEVTYYKLQDSLKVSYEVKLKYNDQKYSIAFGKKGVLKDAEVIIQQKYITPRTLEKIKKYLYNTYASFRIKEIQRQYRNTKDNTAEDAIKDVFSNDKKPSYYYEIIAEVKIEKKRYFIEITFTKEGDFEVERILN